MKPKAVVRMNEVVPDIPDWDEHDAERERMRRHNKKLAAAYEYEEMIREEKEIENAGN